MLAQLILHFLIHLIGVEEGAQTQWQRIEEFFDIHIKPLRARRCRKWRRRRDSSWQFLFRAAFAPTVSENRIWRDDCSHSPSTEPESTPGVRAYAVLGRESRR